MTRIDKALCLELIHEGNAYNEGYSCNSMYVVPLARPVVTGKPDERGDYRWILYDKGANVVASAGFSTLFGEWQSTLPVDAGDTVRSFRECLRVPYVPGGQVAIERRGSMSGFRRVSTISLIADAEPVALPRGVQVHPLYPSPSAGDDGSAPMAGDRVHLVVAAEGYAFRDMGTFLHDAERAIDVLLSTEPYAALREKIFVTGIFQPSRGSGIPLTEEQDATETAFDTSYGGLGMERYLVLRDLHALFESFSSIPVDAVIVLCNSDKYGGSGLFGQLAVVPARVSPSMFDYLLRHEFAHCLAGLADEYFDSAVTYTESWLRANPPWEANVSPLAGGRVRWQQRIAAGTPVPTPWPKEEYVAAVAAARNAHGHMDPEQARSAGLADLLTSGEWAGKVGAFEGARYTRTGLYRPEIDCIMFSKTARHFCAVCQDELRAALTRLLDTGSR